MRSIRVQLSFGAACLSIAVVLGGSSAAAAVTRSSGHAPRGGTPATAAVEPAITPIVKWGWVNVKRTALGTYTPAAIDRGNSSHKANVVHHDATGQYRITMKGLGDSSAGDPGGIVHVSPIGGGNRFCGITDWGTEGATRLSFGLECWTGGTALRADARFTVSFLSTNDAPRRLGYLLADHPTDDYDVTGSRTFNSAGAPNHVTRTGPGTYRVTFPGLGVDKGDVQVTPVFGPSGGAPPRPTGTADVGDCMIGGWGGDVGGDQVVSVNCFDLAGAPADQKFTISFMDRQGLKGPDAGPIAYLWADQAASASYAPDPSYRYSSPAGPPHITRQGVGRYSATLSAMGGGGTAKVSAYGKSVTRCVVKGIRSTGSPQIVRVNCFTFDGLRADSQFTLAYQK
jgi:hypothetical protein